MSIYLSLESRGRWNITADEVQRLFNNIGTAKATKDKVKIVLNQFLEAAKDDKLIDDNPPEVKTS